MFVMDITLCLEEYIFVANVPCIWHCSIMQRVVLIADWCFRTSYWFHLQGSRMIVWVIKVEIMGVLWKHCVLLTVIIFGAGCKQLLLTVTKVNEIMIEIGFCKFGCNHLWIKYNKKIRGGVIVVVTAATANVPGYICTFLASVWLDSGKGGCLWNGSNFIPNGKDLRLNVGLYSADVHYTDEGRQMNVQNVY